jgi:hypothetical protein
MIAHRRAEPPPPRRPGAHLADILIVDLADELRKKAAQLLPAPPTSPRPGAPPAPPPPSTDPATVRRPLAPAAPSFSVGPAGEGGGHAAHQTIPARGEGRDGGRARQGWPQGAERC